MATGAAAAVQEHSSTAAVDLVPGGIKDFLVGMLQGSAPLASGWIGSPAI